MRQITISRDDRFHEAWPSISVAANGDLLVTYKESDGQLSREFSHLVVRISQDQGLTWGDRIVLASVTDPVLEGLLQDAGRITTLQDGSLLLVVSQNASRHQFRKGLPYLLRYMLGGQVLLFRSFDHGQTWQREVAPIDIPMISTVRQLRSGEILIGATAFRYERHPYQNSQVQVVYRSLDNGCTWSKPITVCDHPEFQPSEGDFVELDDGTIVCYLRDEDFRLDLPVRTSGLKCFSRDGGLTWEGPFSAGRWLFNGRIAAGLLASGEVMVTSRLGMGRLRPYFGVFHEEPHRKPELVGYWHYEFPMLHAYVESQADALRRTPPSIGYHIPLPPSGRWMVIDNDLSSHPDFGYSGWVNLPSGDVFVVDYITDDAPPGRSQIRGYLISRQDLLHPDRSAHFRFNAHPYRPGPLAGQDDWVHLSGSREATVVVEHSPPEQPVVEAREISPVAQMRLLSEGWIAPTLDSSQLQAETVRRDIGPYNLYDEAVTIEFLHRGQNEWCAFQILDEFQSVIVELRSTLGHPGLCADLPALRQIVDSDLTVGSAWRQTMVHITAAGVALYTKWADTAEYGPAWHQANLPDLQVVAAIAVTMGGQGNAALGRIMVTPRRACRA